MNLLLIGAGHAHLHVASRAGELTDAGIRPVLIDPGAFWYSGMATGVLAGFYRPEESRVDPAKRIESRGGTFIQASLTRLDPAARSVRLSNGDSLSYDALSLNLGSHVPVPFPVSGDRLAPVKPIHGIPGIRKRIRDLRAETPPPTVAVIGAGATGCEVAACLAELARREKCELDIHLLGRGPEILAGLPQRAARRMREALTRASVKVRTETAVEAVEDRHIHFEQGSSLEADLIIAATGLRPSPLVETLGLPRGPNGGVWINATLQSQADDRIFAAGDCADLIGHNLPRLGVYGVRQAPVLLHNLRAVLKGDSLRSFRPQTRALQILHTGNRRALLIYGPLAFQGRPAFRLKDWIDRRFLEKYRD